MVMQYVIEELVDERLPRGYGGRFYGVYTALVTDIKDPNGQGRVKVKLPWSPDSGSSAYEAWARLATMMGGNNRGSWFVPEPNTEVLIIFEAGDPRHPYVIGSLWNGVDTPPEKMDGAGNNYRKILCSKNGVKVTLDDTDGSETLTLETPGKQKIILKDGQASIEITDGNQNSIKMEASGITINSSKKVTINGPSGVEINGSSIDIKGGSHKVTTGSVTFTGPVTASSNIQTPSIISGSYTPGAGNIW